MRRVVQIHHAVISADIPSDQIAARTNVSNEILILLFVNKCFHERERELKRNWIYSPSTEATGGC